MHRHKVAFIGTGGRSCAYAAAYATCEDIEIVALADPVASHRTAMLERSGVTDRPAEYDDFRDLLATQDDLAGVVIGSPNHLHADHAVPCLERGLPIALEKPLAANQADCERILDAERANGGRTLIGFVLRSAPFYLKAHELIADGAIGRVTSIQADELPGIGVSSIMNRSPWRRYQATSGGSMLEKSCHDMDILNWMMGGRPTSLCSFGGNLIFTPDPTLGETCGECDQTESCLYYKPPGAAAREEGTGTIDARADRNRQFDREDDRCIYNIDKDVVDVQNIAIEYESGAVANFMLNFHVHGPRSGRSFHAVGVDGHLWGDSHDERLHYYDNRRGETIVFDTSGDGSGHGGGDRLHALELRRMMAEPGYTPEQNAQAGYLSAVMCFASDISRIERRRVEFCYDDADRIGIR